MHHPDQVEKTPFNSILNMDPYFKYLPKGYFNAHVISVIKYSHLIVSPIAIAILNFLQIEIFRFEKGQENKITVGYT